MKTVAIICEYNPFHNGHLYQISEIRKEFGEDTEIVAVMSGNFTQRGETAIADKGARAKCAILSGVNLVLELPFPFSASSAEIFARSAVKIIEDLGCCDYISFGSESGDIDLLQKTADVMLSDKFATAISSVISSPEYKTLGYPERMEIALTKCADFTIPTLTPNNILAIEYVKALKMLKSKVKIHTVKRSGAGYSEGQIIDGALQSASAIRSALYKKDISALEYTPKAVKEVLLEEFKNGSFPCDMDRLSTSIISSFRLNSPTSPDTIQDAGGGLYNRLKDKSLEANNIETLFTLAETKGYTRARIRRAILSSFIGVTSSDVKDFPAYTQILALDDKGRAILKRLKVPEDFFVITKPSSTAGLSQIAKKQKDLSDKADSVFQLTKPIPPSGGYSLRFTPYVKE